MDMHARHLAPERFDLLARLLTQIVTSYFRHRKNRLHRIQRLALDLDFSQPNFGLMRPHIAMQQHITGQCGVPQRHRLAATSER